MKPGPGGASLRLPARLAPVVMALQLSVLMTMVVSAVSTARGVGFGPSFAAVWLSAWGLSWLAAFPTLVVLLPIVRRITGWLCRPA